MKTAQQGQQQGLSRFWPGYVPFIIAITLLEPTSVIFLTPYTFAIFLSLLLTYAVATYLAGPLQQQFWSGYLTLVIASCWLLLGLAPALLIVIIGALGCSLRFLFPKSCTHTYSDAFRINYLGRVGISGLGAIAGFILYVELGGQIPLMDNDTRYIAAFLASMALAYGISQWLGRFFTQAPMSLFEWRGLIFEVVLWFVPPLVAHVYFRIGLEAYLILLGLVWFQFFRYYQVSRAQTSLIQRLRELSTLNRVGQSISANLELDDVLQSIYREVSQIVDATTFLIALYDETRELVDYRLVVKDGQKVVWPARKLNNGITDSIIRDKKPLLIHKSDDQRLAQLGIAPSAVESAVYLGVPLIVSGKLIGVMSVYHERNPAAIVEEDIKILQTIANQAALAIRNASLYDRTTRIAHQLSLINQSVQNVLFNLDSEEAIRLACQTAMTIARAPHCALYLISPTQADRITLAYNSGLGEAQERYRQLWQAHMERGTVELIIVTDTATLPDPMAGQTRDLGLGAYAIIPLRSGNTPVGYMVLAHPAPYYYQKPELDLLEMLANQVTAALDNAELLKALKSYASEQAQLVYLSRMASTSLELEQVIVATAEVLKQMIDITDVFIGLVVPGRERLRLYQTHDDARLSTTEWDISAIAEIAQLLQHRASDTFPIYHRDAADISAPLRDFMSQKDLAICIILPMVVAGDSLGVLLLGHQQERHFSDNNRRLIEMAANQITAQLQNAQIYTLTEEALVQRLQHLSVIEDIAQQISRSLKLDIIIGNVLDASIRSTQADRAMLTLLEGGGYQVVERTANGRTDDAYQIHPQERQVIAEVVRTREPIIITNRPAPAAQDRFLSILGVPLIKDERVIGVLNLESEQPDFFTQEQVSFIRSLADHATISIQNARLIEDHEHQIQILTLLRDMALKSAKAANMRELATALAQSALQIFAAKGCVLFYKDEESGRILVRSGQQWNGAAYQNTAIFVPDDLITSVMRDGHILFVADIASDPFYAGLEDIEQIGYQRLIALPLAISEEATEILCVTFDDRGHFSDRLRGAVELFSIQARALLENALLNDRLRANNDRMRAILDSTRDGIILLDSEMRLLEANIAAERLLGIDLNDRIGENFARVLFDYTNTLDDNPAGIDEELRNMARILRTEPQRITQREYVLTNRPEPLYIKEVGAPVYNRAGRIIGRLLALHDITEDKAIELYRKKVSEMVYHDLRGPISTTISGLTFALDLIHLMDDDSVDKKDLLALTDAGLANARIVLKRVNTLLDIAKGDKLQPNFAVASLSQIIANVLLPKMSVFEDVQITITNNVPTDLNVYADVELIERVVDNLVDNAFKYTPKGGQVLVTADTIPAQQAERVRVRICDTGPGIPLDKRDVIFKEFEQIENTRPERGGRGSGLGLAFCKLAVKAHGGTIEVEPDGPLPGACIAFTLPLPPPNED